MEKRKYTASKLAACIGENPHEAVNDVFEELFMGENQDVYNACIKKYKPASSFIKKKRMLYNSLNSPEAKAMRKIQTDGSKNITEKVESLQNVENSTLTAEQHTLLMKHCKSQSSTNHGVKSEQTALDLYANQTNQPVEKFAKLCSKEYGNFVIRGKMDGIVKGEDGTFKVVEVKNRTRRLFHQVVSYEYCQTQCYLWIHDQQHCDLVEKYKDTINIFPIERNESYIAFMLHALEKFDDLLTRIQGDEEVQREYFTQEDQEGYLKNLIK